MRANTRRRPLTDNQVLIMTALAEHGGGYAYGIAALLDIPLDAVRSALQSLAVAEYVTSRIHESTRGPAQRVYTLSRRGRKARA